jgi:MarR family transcriptional regulator, lower aerobic nicotinate degradation pathway regulator
MTSSKTDAAPLTLDALYKRPGFMLRRAHQISVSLFMQQPEAAGMTTTQYGVLVILRACEGLDQIGLSKKVGLDRSTTGLVIKNLENEGYVVRIADPKDRRRKVIVLTAKGERKLESLRVVAAKSQEMALSVFTPTEAEQFINLLTKFVHHYNGITRVPIIIGD